MKKFYQDKTDNLKISYEIFPPKNDTSSSKTKQLLEELNKLKQFKPSLISVTYGAGGSNREKSLDIVKLLLKNFETIIMPHFTCICSSKDYINNYLKEIQSLNITNILALRGDEPQDINVCYKDFTYAWQLVDFIHNQSDLNIAVAGYPEGHPRAKNLACDIENLKKKIDMGGNIIFTQLFFDNDFYYKFCELCAKENINVPIIPGVLPITNFSQLERMTSMCGATLPKGLIEHFEKYKDSEEDIQKAGIEYATNQCRKLIEFGVGGLHFYTLNKSHSTSEVLKNIL